jgi:hypothetical protein
MIHYGKNYSSIYSDTTRIAYEKMSTIILKSFFVIPFYLQSVELHSANCVKTYTMACKRGLSSAFL